MPNKYWQSVEEIDADIFFGGQKDKVIAMFKKLQEVEYDLAVTKEALRLCVKIAMPTKK